MWHMRRFYDLPRVLQVRILITSDNLLGFLCGNVGPSEVHNVHPIHPFLVKPPCRSNCRSERPNGARALDNSDEPRKWQQYIYMPSCPLTPIPSPFDSGAP